jgi:hypothetical protein
LVCFLSSRRVSSYRRNQDRDSVGHSFAAEPLRGCLPSSFTRTLSIQFLVMPTFSASSGAASATPSVVSSIRRTRLCLVRRIRKRRKYRTANGIGYCRGIRRAVCDGCGTGVVEAWVPRRGVTYQTPFAGPPQCGQVVARTEMWRPQSEQGRRFGFSE